MASTATGLLSMLKSRVRDLVAPKSAYTRSVHKPQWPFLASKVPMKVNFSASMTCLALTSMFGPVPVAGNEVLPPMAGNQP